jgi:general secretion pathway protein B
VPVPPPPSLPVPAASLAPAAPVSGPALEPAAELAPPADGRVLDRAELPQQVQASLPPLRISAHVWSEEPALRLLSVDDRLVHEGAEAAPGVVLREITPAGAVFERAGWRFRVSGGRP